MSDVTPSRMFMAISDFRRARREAALEEVMARLLGRSAALLPFDEVRQKLRATNSTSRGLQEIPLAAIVGSVGRYTDFTRSFLPRRESDQERWTRVQVAITDLGQFPPIEVYQIGEVYFVVDGNHRVSIARTLGTKTIQAHVTELQAKVPLAPTDQPDELILKAEYVGFLERTNLDTLRPAADLRVTAPGRYREFEEQIEVHRYDMSQERGKEVPYAEAVAHWYDTVYYPVVEAIRARGILHEFPGRTEADLYIWLSRHRAALQEALGWEVPPTAAASDLAAQHSQTPQRVAARLGERLKEALTPEELVEGPEPGHWRRERLSDRWDSHLFLDLLVPVSGEEVGWCALEQALVVAQREGGRLIGLHVIPLELRLINQETKAVQAEFERRCEAAGVTGHLVFRVGRGVAAQICDRALWADLVVVNLAHPPASQPLARLKSGFRTLVRRCPRPILAAPGRVSPLDHALLAYDGSPKAREALYVATYLAGQWGISLVVLSVNEKGAEPPDALAEARTYLEGQGVQASYLHERGPVAERILHCAEAHARDLIIMGGYGASSVREAVLGSAVDKVLRESGRAMLICR